jgi:ankyrin repeat protein
MEGTSVDGAGSSGFVVASRESEWSAALKTRDCKKLLSLLQKKPRLWRKTDPNCRTVLHVAAMQGCSQLANDVLRCVKGNNPSDIQSSQEMLLSAKEKSLCDADAFSLAKIVGNRDIMDMINTVKSGTKLQPIPGVTMSQDAAALSRIIEVLTMEGGKYARAAINLKEKFEHDVDYNFVESQKHLLYLHVAFKQSEFWDFVHAVIERTKTRSYALLEALFNLKDAQGRTLLHVAVEEDGLGDKRHDTYMANAVKNALAIFGADPVCDATVFKKCVNSRDLAGRTPLHRAVANQRAGSALINALVEHRMTDVNAIWTGDIGEQVTGNVTALHLAVWHNNFDAVKILLRKAEINREIVCTLFIEASGIQRSPNRDLERKLSGRKWTALELATIRGRVHIVKLLLEVRN